MKSCIELALWWVVVLSGVGTYWAWHMASPSSSGWSNLNSVRLLVHMLALRK